MSSVISTTRKNGFFASCLCSTTVTSSAAAPIAATTATAAKRTRRWVSRVSLGRGCGLLAHDISLMCPTLAWHDRQATAFFPVWLASIASTIGAWQRRHAPSVTSRLPGLIRTGSG